MYDSDEHLHQAIGRKIRSLRLHNRMTLEQLGSRSGVSKSMLSMIEAGQRGASVRLLLRIAKSMKVSVAELLEEVEHKNSAVLVRREAQTQEVLSEELAIGSVYHLVEMDWSNLFLRMYEYHLKEIPDSPAVFQHPGYWIVFVQSGSIEFHVDGNVHLLSAGDAIACDADIPHSMAKIVNGPVKMIGLQAWVHNHSPD